MSSLAALDLLPDEDRAGIPLCERALVGALMIDGGLRKRVLDLRPEQFKNEGLATLFEIAMEMEGPIDLVIMVEEAERRGLKWATASYVAGLLDLVPDVENIEDYAARVKRASIARQVEEMRESSRRRAFNGRG